MARGHGLGRTGASRVQRGGPDYFVDVGAHRLTSRLKDLAVGAGGRGSRKPATRLFTTALPREVRLERLAWTDPCWDPAAMCPILDRHGTSLRRLELWSHEPWNPVQSEAEAALIASQVQRIAEGAPNLEHLVTQSLPERRRRYLAMGGLRGGRVGLTAGLGRCLA